MGGNAEGVVGSLSVGSIGGTAGGGEGVGKAAVQQANSCTPSLCPAHHPGVPVPPVSVATDCS